MKFGRDQESRVRGVQQRHARAALRVMDDWPGGNVAARTIPMGRKLQREAIFAYDERIPYPDSPAMRTSTMCPEYPCS